MEHLSKKEGTQDRRVRKTRAILKQCLIQELQHKRIQEISVRELTELADVNRGTFYLHYKDVFDLLEQAEEELLQEFHQAMQPYGPDLSAIDPASLFEDVYRFCKENAAFIRILIGENGDIKFLNHLKHVIKTKCLTEWHFIEKTSKSADFDFYYAFVVGGCLSLLQLWFANDMQKTPKQLALLTGEILSGGLSMAMLRGKQASPDNKK